MHGTFDITCNEVARDKGKGVEEQEAISRLKRGDISGLEILVCLYQAEALRVSHFVTGDFAESQDVVQAAFLKVYERIEQFDDRRPFAPWFLRIVINDAVKQATRHKRSISLDTTSDTIWLSDLLSSVGINPADITEHNETRLKIQAALSQLSPKQRSAIIQRYYLDMSEGEMARASRCQVGTVKSRLHAARGQLRRLLNMLERSD